MSHSDERHRDGAFADVGSVIGEGANQDDSKDDATLLLVPRAPVSSSSAMRDAANNDVGEGRQLGVSRSVHKGRG